VGGSRHIIDAWQYTSRLARPKGPEKGNDRRERYIFSTCRVAKTHSYAPG
jgi:hypothetical protein